jgi:type IV secretion system protein VirD4
MPDEFRSLGKMKVLVNGIAFFRGYGLRVLPIFQAPSQVREVYGDDAAKTFFKNHHVRIAYTPADIDDATEVSRELGNFTYKATSKSKPMAFSKGTQSQSESDQARALLLPQEVKDIGEDEAIIFAKGCKPLRVTKIRWYKDPTFKGRVVDPPKLSPAPLPVAAPVEDSDWTEVDASDVETLYDRPASDFSLDFSDVDIPKGELSDTEAEALADELYASLVR